MKEPKKCIVCGSTKLDRFARRCDGHMKAFAKRIGLTKANTPPPLYNVRYTSPDSGWTIPEMEGKRDA